MILPKIVEELKSLLLRVKKSEKAGLKLNIKHTHTHNKIVASGPITSWQIEREKVEAVTDFIFLGSLPNHCGWWLQPRN